MDNAIGAVQLAHDIHIPQVTGLLPGLRLPFVRFERCPHITQPASVPTGPTQTSRRDFSFCACLSELWSALFRPWIVASHDFTIAVTEGDGSVRVPGHQGSKQPTSNGEPVLRNGAGCLRNSHVAFGVLGDGALSAVDGRVGFHSPGLRHANVTAITGAHFTLDISPRMNGVVKARKHLGGNSRDQLCAK